MKNLIITLFVFALCSCAPMTQELEQTGGPPSPPGQPAGTTIRTNSGTTLPVTCTTGQMFIDTDADTNGSLYVCVATDTWKLDDDDGGAGGGTMTTVEEGDVQVGGNDIVTLDCGAGLDCTETPDTEINIVVDLSETGLGGTHDTSAELDAMYEVQLNNEAGLYAVLSDVSDFVQPAEVDVEMLSDVTGEGTAATYALFDDNDGTYSFRAIADGDVPDTITASNYLLLAGGTLTGEVVVDNLGLEFTEGDDHSDCTAFSATGGGIWYDDSEGKFKKCQDNVLTDLDTDTGGTTALDDVGDPDANNSISMAGYTDTRVSTTDGWGGLILHSNVANNASPTTLLTLQFDDANDSTNNSFLKIIEDADGTPATLFEFKGRTLTLGTNASIEGIATITASTSVGTAAAEIPDYYGGDGHVLYLGDDQDVTLTHVADTGVLLNAAMQLQFRDSALHISSVDDGHLDLAADTSIDLNANVVLGASTLTVNAVEIVGSDGEVNAAAIEDAYLLNNGDAGTGVYDFGGATSFEVPNGADPTTDAFGELAADNNAWAASYGALEFFNGTASTFLVGIDAADTCTNGQIPKFNTAGNWTCEDDTTGGTTAYDTIGDPTGAGSISFDDGETATYDGANDNETFFTISLNAADLTGDTTGLLITAVDNDDANYIPLLIQDDQDGTPDDLFKVDYQGLATITGGVDLGSAGVRLSGDGDGAITLLGLGDGSDEDLTINLDDTANTVVLSSSTGVTEIDAGSFQLVTTGDIMGAVNISSKTAATYTVGTDDSHESYGTLFINGDNDAIDFTLPSAVAGMSACFMQGQGVSGAITVQPNTGDYLVVDGTRGTVATDYDSSGAGGDKLCVIAMDATDWIVTTEQGTWSE